MTLKTSELRAAGGTVEAPEYFELSPAAVANVNAEVNKRLYTYKTGLGVVAGSTTSIVFTVERSARDVWPYFKDFNLWQKGHYYSGVVGDLEGQTYTLSDKPNDLSAAYRRRVIKVVPEYLIITAGAVEGGPPVPGMPGLGGVNAGWSVYSLHEHGQQTIVTVFIEHGSYASRGEDITVQEALAPWRKNHSAKWSNEFIPALKNLVLTRAR